MSEPAVSETGLVVGRHDGLVEIEIEPSAQCLKCGLCRPESNGAMRIEVRGGEGLEVGQKVLVAFPFKSRWRPIFWILFLPLALFFAVGIAASAAAGVLGATSGAAAAAGMAGALAGLATGLALARRPERAVRKETFERTLVRPLEGERT